MKELPKDVIYAAAVGQIIPDRTRAYAFFVYGPNRNRAGAYTLARRLAAACRARYADYRLMVDAYKDKPHGQVRRGYLLVSITDPVSLRLEQLNAERVAARARHAAMMAAG